jgi:transcriptional regulator with XRE-family HTH domain
MNTTALKIRNKKLGALMRDARQAAYKNPEECARIMGVSAEVYAAYERGESAPSLPELEMMALHLAVPMEHFWGDISRSEMRSPAEAVDRTRLVALRQRIIGAQLRSSRLEQNLSLQATAEKIGVREEQLAAYELGKEPIPLPVLEGLSELLGRPVREFLDQHGPVGLWNTQQRAVKGFSHLNPELQAFVSKPVNRPYLELAQRLSEMSVDRLRAVAEGLLEITL